MSKHLSVHIIEHARSLIADEAHWCRRQIAVDADDVPVCAADEKASKLCAYGALMAAAHQMTGDRDRACELTSRVVSSFGGSSALIKANDTDGHAAVVALFDEVIARQRAGSLAL
jgi:hypothetical protein